MVRHVEPKGETTGGPCKRQNSAARNEKSARVRRKSIASRDPAGRIEYEQGSLDLPRPNRKEDLVGCCDDPPESLKLREKLRS